ncbi:MAG: VWA domain-containing protein [Candidatus Sumerlaeaceae bacterium]|nr:VWA domain-containing protein [Candidatus Sumerlaeaceae bacterium]
MAILRVSWLSSWAGVAAAILGMVVTRPVAAGLEPQAALKASLATPVVLAGKKQTVYLKVGITGFALPRDGKRPPVNLAIVLDRSGSMTGQKLEDAKKAAIMALDQLDSADIVSVVTYDNTVNVLVPATKMTDKGDIVAKIQTITAGGSTALFAGVSKGSEEVRKFLNKERVNRVILLSDGIANVGPSSPDDLGGLGGSLMKEGITVSTIGLGLDYNEDLMTKLSAKAGGSHYFAETPRDLAKTFEREFDRSTRVVGQEVVARIECAPGVRPIRVLGRDAEITGQMVSVPLDQLYSESEKYLILEIELPDGRDTEEREAAKVEVSYLNMKTKETDRVKAAVPVRFTNSPADVESKTDRDAMVSAVEQVATEKSQTAMKLRDQGKVKEARELLMSNSGYLASNAGKYGSQKLVEYQQENEKNANNLDDANWQRTRKSQSAGDVWRVKQ